MILFGRQAGVTLLELIMSIAIMSSVMAGATLLVNQYQEEQQLASVSEHLRTVANATKAYITDNWATVALQATATTPAVIDVADLTAATYLPAGFMATNAFGQTVRVLVLEPAAVPPATVSQLTAIVVTTGGTGVDDASLGAIVRGVGAAGGGIFSTNTPGITSLKFSGLKGGWSMLFGDYARAPVTLAGATEAAGVELTEGHPVMALWFDGGAGMNAANGFLYREAIAGQPQLNQMNTPIVMMAVSTVGASCAPGVAEFYRLGGAASAAPPVTTVGAISRDATGKILTCNGAIWQSQASLFWGDPVARRSDLDTLPATEQCVVGNPNIKGQTRVVHTPASLAAEPRAYTCNGTAWKPLALDDGGALIVPGSFEGRGTSKFTEGLTVEKTATIDKLAGNLQITKTATDGTACTPDGQLAMSTVTSGKLLTCQTTWKAANTPTSETLKDLYKVLNTGKVATCSDGTDSVTAIVDPNGQVLMRVLGAFGCGTGGFVAKNYVKVCGGNLEALVTLEGIMMNGFTTSCQGQWN